MIFDLSLLFFLIILLVPLAAGFLGILLKISNQRRVLLFEVPFMIVLLSLLWFMGEGTILTGLSFMGEVIYFSISLNGVLLYFGLLVALWVMVWRITEKDRDVITRWQFVLVQLALPFGFVALMSGQFMIRYIALDVVGLLVATSVLNSFSDKSRFRGFSSIFLLLRLGDLFLLASILLLNHHVGTLDISQMIDAGAKLDIWQQIWVYVGFISAVLIKSAVWPFSIWLRRAKRSASGVSFWIAGLLMPVLGYYLLYRILPIVNSSILFQLITFIVGFLVLILSILFSYGILVVQDRFIRMGSVSGGFILIAAAFTGGKAFGYYLLAWVIHRLILLLSEDTKSSVLVVISYAYPAILNIIYIGFNVSETRAIITVIWLFLTGLSIYWDIVKNSSQKAKIISADGLGTLSKKPYFEKNLAGFAGWLNQKLEIDIFTSGLVRLSAGLVSFAQWLHRNLEMNVLTQGIEKLGRTFNSIANWTQSHVEQGIDNVLIWIGREFVHVSEDAFDLLETEIPARTGDLMDGTLHSLEGYERRMLKKKLRWDLALIPLFFVVILVFLLIF